MGGLCPKAQLCLRSPAIPSGCYELGTTSAGLTSTRERRCLGGSESGLTLGGRSMSCTRWRLLDDVLLEALDEPETSLHLASDVVQRAPGGREPSRDPREARSRRDIPSASPSKFSQRGSNLTISRPWF